MVSLVAVRVPRRAGLGWVPRLPPGAGGGAVRAAARAKDVPRSVCSFLFALPLRCQLS